MTGPDPFRTLPHNKEAERATLGAMLQRPDAIGEVVAILGPDGPDCFLIDQHRLLCRLLFSFWTGGKPVDALVIEQEFRRRGEWEQLGGYDFLARMVTAVASASRVGHYAEIVREKHLLRQLIGACSDSMAVAYDDALPCGDILDGAEQRVCRVTERRVGASEAAAVPDLIASAFAEIEARSSDKLAGVATGLTALDEDTCGLQRGELIVIGARPSVGKTALGVTMADNIAARGEPVLFVSLEMKAQAIIERLLVGRARVDSHRLRRGTLPAEKMEQVRLAAQELERVPIVIDDRSGLSVMELRATARVLHRRWQFVVVFVDYLQLLHDRTARSREQEVAAISRGLKALAKDLNVPVVAMAQLNRKPEERERMGNRPRLSDLRESGSIEADADVVLLLHRESYHARQAAAEESGSAVTSFDTSATIIIAKQRNGPTGDIQAHYLDYCARFENRGYDVANGYAGVGR